MEYNAFYLILVVLSFSKLLLLPSVRTHCYTKCNGVRFVGIGSTKNDVNYPHVITIVNYSKKDKLLIASVANVRNMTDAKDLLFHMQMCILFTQPDLFFARTLVGRDIKTAKNITNTRTRVLELASSINGSHLETV